MQTQQLKTIDPINLINFSLGEFKIDESHSENFSGVANDIHIRRDEPI